MRIQSFLYSKIAILMFWEFLLGDIYVLLFLKQKYCKVTRWVEFLTVWRLRTVMFMLQVEEPSDQQWGVYNYPLSNTSKSKRQHSCTVCGRQFSTSRDLGRHHMTHTGEKPFHCPYCPHRANRKGNLKFHIIAVHFGKNADAASAAAVATETNITSPASDY